MKRLFFLIGMLAVASVGATAQSVEILPDRVITIKNGDTTMVKSNGLRSTVLTSTASTTKFVQVNPTTGFLQNATPVAAGGSSYVPQAAYVNIPAWMFTSRTFYQVPVFDEDRGTVYYNSGSEVLQTALLLPDSVIFDTIEVFGVDAVEDIDLRINLYVSGVNTAESTKLATILLDGNAEGVRMVSETINRVVSNANSMFYLTVQAVSRYGNPAEWVGQGVELKGVTINYHY